MQKTKIWLSQVWNKIQDILFELGQIEVAKIISISVLPQAQEAGAFGNNRKWTTKVAPKIEKMCVLYIYCPENLGGYIENICPACNVMQVVVFCKNVLIL